MPSFHRIEDLPPLAGQTVITRGWVMTTRSSGKIGFVMLRDGTGYLQVVLSKKDVPEAAWEAFGGLTQETSVEVTGTVRADARAPGGVELTATDLDPRAEPRLPDHAERARHRVPVRAPPPVAPEPAPGGDRAGAPRGRPGDPRLLLRAALHPRGYADPHRGDRRARRDAVRHRVFRPRESLPRPNGTAVRRSRGGGARQGLLLRTDVSSGKIEDPAPPDRVLDGRARSGVERLGCQHAAAGGVRFLHRHAGIRASEK